MNSRRLVGVALAVLVLGFSNHIFSQEQITVQKSYPVPDSVRQDLARQVDSSRIQRNWDKLQKGMTFEQVKSLLGKPTKLSSDDRDHSTTWHYGKHVVVFDNVKQTVRFWEVLP